VLIGQPAIVPTVAPAGSAVSVGGDLIIATGAANAQVMVAEATVGENLLVKAGASANIQIGSMPDTAPSLKPTAAPSQATVASVSVSNNLLVLAGNGGDTIRLNSVSAKMGFVAVGKGDNSVSLTQTAFDQFYAALGAGNNVLDTRGGDNVIGQLWAAATTTSTTTNTFIDSPTNQITTLKLHGFTVAP
jgi:hypothetical protein